MLGNLNSVYYDGAFDFWSNKFDFLSDLYTDEEFRIDLDIADDLWNYIDVEDVYAKV